MISKKIPVFVLGASLMVAVAGCGKKAATTSSSKKIDVTELELTSELVLLPAKTDDAPSLDGAPAGPKRNSSDASVRELRLRVNSDAFEAAKQVENILCYFSQTRFWEQVGKGAYQVLVDEDKCESDKGDDSQAQEGGSSSASQGKNYITAFASSEKVGKGVEAKILFRMERDGVAQEYHAKINVTQKLDDSYPIGLFDMFFTGYYAGQKAGSGSIKVAKGSGKKFTIEFMETSDEGSRTNTTQLMAELTKDGDDFVGQLNSKGASTETQGSYTYEYKVAFDKNFANVSGTSSNTFGGGGGGGGGNTSDPTGCYDRNQFITAIYNYDLADANNNLKELNTGFPIEATINGKTVMGYAGYHGIGFNDQSLSGKIANGDTVNRVTFEDKVKTPVPYTVVKAPGKLIKLTRSTTTLGALKGDDLMMHDSGSNYIVRWDGSAFTKVKKVTYGQNGPVEEDVTGSTAVTIPNWGLFIFVQNLNAGIKIPSGTLTDATEIGYHSEQIVTNATAAPSESLVCFQDCPKVTFTSASQMQRSDSQNGNCRSTQPMFETGSTIWNCPSNGRQTLGSGSDTAIATYTFDTATMNLKNGATAFTLPDLSSVDQEDSHSYNFRSGALIPSSVHSALSSTIKSKYPGTAEMEIDTFYRWESGASPWSQLTALKDASGTIAAFDRPLEISYTHTTGNDFDSQSTYNGKSFRLNYGGPGQLWGIPMKYASDYGRGAPMFSLKAGSTVGDYKAYPVRGEQYMKKLADTASCASLPVTNMPALPTAVDAAASAIENTADIASATEIRYIGGEAMD